MGRSVSHLLEQQGLLSFLGNFGLSRHCITDSSKLYYPTRLEKWLGILTTPAHLVSYLLEES